MVKLKEVEKSTITFRNFNSPLIINMEKQQGYMKYKVQLLTTMELNCKSIRYTEIPQYLQNKQHTYQKLKGQNQSELTFSDQKLGEKKLSKVKNTKTEHMLNHLNTKQKNQEQQQKKSMKVNAVFEIPKAEKLPLNRSQGRGHKSFQEMTVRCLQSFQGR